MVEPVLSSAAHLLHKKRLVERPHVFRGTVANRIVLTYCCTECVSAPTEKGLVAYTGDRYVDEGAVRAFLLEHNIADSVGFIEWKTRRFDVIKEVQADDGLFAVASFYIAIVIFIAMVLGVSYGICNLHSGKSDKEVQQDQELRSLSDMPEEDF